VQRSICELCGNRCRGPTRGPGLIPSTVELPFYLRESVAHACFGVHSDVMTSIGGQQYFWCLAHHRVEPEATACSVVDRLGPYSSAAEAERALDRVRERNDAWDAEDARWNGEVA